MRKTRKVMALLLALVMALGLAVPAFAEQETTYDVVVHKLKVQKAEVKTIEGYDGGKIDQQKLEQAFGTAEELDNVTFTYWQVSKEQYDVLTAAAASYDTVEKVKTKYPELGDGTNFTTGAGKGATVEGLTKGYYWFVEHKGSNLGDGTTLSEAAAVPFGLQLPVYKVDGSTFGQGPNALHVYPKNTVTGVPEVTKTIDNNEKPKADFNVGDSVPYTVKTTIKAGAKYQTADWSDQMTEGLTYNQDVKVTIGGVLASGGDYNVQEYGNGFKLSLTPQGLQKINAKENDVVVELKYTATLNEKALVEVPESNDVMFHYGNNPNHGNTPIPGKPDPQTGSVTLEKQWADGSAPSGVKAIFDLINAQTGETVEAGIELSQDKGWSYTKSGLDKDVEYKFVERYITGYSAEYIQPNGGNFVVKNYKDDNPGPINPQEPKVETFGKKFVKTGAEGARLPDAEFLVKDNKGDGAKYLVLKTGDQTADELTKYYAAEKAYQEAVKNGKPQDDIKNLKSLRDAAFVAKSVQWTWGSKENAFVFKSNENGQFEVTGLKAGTYYLEEQKAPTGYAKLTGEIAFTVGANSYTENGTISYVPESGKNDAQQIENKKVTIPQTGGIGTVIFIAAGLAIMGGSIFAMKRSKKNEEA